MAPPRHQFKRERLQEYLADRDVPCPKCGYSLRGLKSGECPECGCWFTFWDLIRGRSRRRPLRLWPAAAAVLAACGGLAATILHAASNDPVAIAGLACPAVGITLLFIVLTDAGRRVRRGRASPAAVSDGAAWALWGLAAMLAAVLAIWLAG